MLDGERNRIFEEWIEAHKAILFKVARAYGVTPADREDLFQEIALHVWHSVDAFRGDSAVVTWIYRVALNTALAWTRKQSKHERGRQDLDPSTTVLIAPPHQDPRLDWIYQRIAELDFGWPEAASIAFLVATGVWCSIEQSRRIRRTLLPRRQRLSELLESLNASE